VEEDTQDGDYNDFNDLDYDSAKQLLMQGNNTQSSPVSQPNYEVNGINYDDALKLLNESKAADVQNVPRKTSTDESSITDNDPSITDRAMASFLHQQSPLGPTKDYDPLAYKDTLMDKILKGGVDVLAGALPFQMGASGLMRTGARYFPKLAQFVQKDPYFASSALENAIAGAAYNKAQGDSGVPGAVAGALSPLPGAVISPLAKYAAKTISQSALPGLTARATGYMRNLLSPNEYAANLKSGFNQAYSDNQSNWNKVDEAASALDNALGQSGAPPGTLVKAGQSPSVNTFNNKPYLDYINDYINKIGNLEPARREEYSQALDFAQKAKDLAPQSIQGAVSSYQNLNQALKEFMGSKGVPAANRQAKEFVSGLKDNIKENMSNDFLDSKMKDLGYDQTFSDIWNQANKSHADLQNFYKVPDRFGTPQEKKSFKLAMQSPDGDEGALIGQYMPKPSQTGTEGLDQLANVMGSKEDAQAAAKAYINRRPLTNGVSTLDVSNEYAKLSPAQRDWIYGDSPEGKLLKATNDTRMAFGKEPSRSLLTAGTHSLMGYGLPGIAGYLASDYAGGNWEENFLAALAAAGGAHGMGKLMGRLSPEAVQNITAYAKRSPVNYSRYLNVPLQTMVSGGNQQ